MTRRFGNALFWIFFIPYTLGVVVFLLAGLAPSVAKEFGALHQSLHDYAGDALAADRPVTIHFENAGLDHEHRIVIRGPVPQQQVVGRAVVPPGGRATMQFAGPPPGSYRMTSIGHPDLNGELQFTRTGAETAAIRVPALRHGFERADIHGLNVVAQRVAEASHGSDHGGRVTLETLFSVLNLGLGLILITRRPHDRTARLLAVAMIGTAATFNHQAHSTVRDYLIGDWWFAHDMFHLFSGLAYMYAVIVFPDGRLVPLESRHRWALRAVYAIATVVLASFVLNGVSTGHPGQPFFTVLFGLLIPLVGVVAQSYRLHHATDPVRRQQSRLLRWALLPIFAAAALSLALRGFDATRVEDVGLAVFPALFALVPIALVMGILRYRLWDIDVLVSRTLLSVGLAAFIGFVYVVVVVLFGHALGSSGSAGLKILATAIAAVAFEPVRERLSRFANRLVYGKRATPYEVMTECIDRLGGAISVDEVLPRIAEASVRGVGGVAGQVTAFLPGGGRRTVEWPEASVVTSFPFVVPVVYHGEQVAEIAVATAHGERLRPEDEELLAALAAQAGLAVNNARLTIELQARLQEISVQAADLRASRQRIVTARQVQRQRVVQIIHDRVEVRLHHATEVLGDLEPLLVSDAGRAVDCIDTAREECGDALDSLRELARGIFPAILADQGLVPALQAYLLQDRMPVDVRLDTVAAAERFDPQAEATVYFCIIQALANAATYAPGSSVIVVVHARIGNLAFSIADNGPGADTELLAAGADVRDMRDRVEAIGGAFEAISAPGAGTVISGWVPVGAREVVSVGAP